MKTGPVYLNLSNFEKGALSEDEEDLPVTTYPSENNIISLKLRRICEECKEICVLEWLTDGEITLCVGCGDKRMDDQNWKHVKVNNLVDLSALKPFSKAEINEIKEYFVREDFDFNALVQVII